MKASNKLQIEYSDKLPGTYRVNNGDKKSIALVCGTLKDANLFAAAPEMLETLILLEKYIKLVGGKVPDTCSALNLCQDAIKKAKGV